jgi:hypothetical protein
MTDSTNRDHVEVTDEGRRVADAGIGTSPGLDATAHVDFHAESGHLPPGTRSKLVDAVMDVPAVRGSAHLEASLPSSDAESMTRLRERTTEMSAHVAGSTILVSAKLQQHDGQPNADGGPSTVADGDSP